MDRTMPGGAHDAQELCWLHHDRTSLWEWQHIDSLQKAACCFKIKGQAPSAPVLFCRAGSTVSVTVNNRYNTYDFGGKKYVVLSENSWVGGKNTFLGILMIVLGALALAIALGFFAAYHLGIVKRRRFGDLSQLSWNKNK